MILSKRSITVCLSMTSRFVFRVYLSLDRCCVFSFSFVLILKRFYFCFFLFAFSLSLCIRIQSAPVEIRLTLFTTIKTIFGLRCLRIWSVSSDAVVAILYEETKWVSKRRRKATARKKKKKKETYNDSPYTKSKSPTDTTHNRCCYEFAI